MNTQVHEDEEFIQRKDNEMDKQLFSTVFAIIYNTFWGLLFFLFRYFNDTQCSTINFWTLTAEIYLLLVALYKITVELPVHYKAQGQWKSKLFFLIDYAEFAINFIILIGLTYAYFQYEECLNLRKFVLGYLIITYAILIAYIITLIAMLANKQ